MIYRVAVPSPLRRLFDYLPLPDSDATAVLPGCRVLVPFGKRLLVGVMVERSATSTLPLSSLRPIKAIIDSEPLLPSMLFGLLLWAVDYYQHPPGEAVLAALPVLLRKGEPLVGKVPDLWQLSRLGAGLPAGALRRAPRQQALIDLLRDGTQLSGAEISGAGIARAILKALEQKGLLERVEPESPGSAPALGTDFCPLLAEPRLSPSPEQQQVLDSLELHGFHSYLLQGETGSGKTEIYLQAIERVLRYGRQALVLVPEISLTPQTVDRFRRRFRGTVVLLHSGLTDRERLQAWNAARSGSAAVIIGTRSAVFTPLAKPGILIVDEEHDPSYKQQDGFRYSARDVAVMRASREQIPLILGSATPSLESLYNSERGRYEILHLRSRPGVARQPRWQRLDIRRAPLTHGLAAPLIDAIDREVQAGNQVLVFLNRRGFAPTLMCHDCGWIAECRYCASRLTVHQQRRTLLCHHCEQQLPTPDHCPECAGSALICLGQGTERCEANLAEMFPGTPVWRVDRDSTRRKLAMQELLEKIESGTACILVGTQLLAKGHHFPNVTLVAILDADGGLLSPDFRATERMGQLITQVAGRAGRGHKPGTVILQSHHCDHPLVTTLTGAGYPAFAESLLQERRRTGLPPFRHLALFRAESAQAEAAETLLRRLRRQAELWVPPEPSLTYLGPLPSPLEKRAGRYRFQLILLDENRQRLQQLLGRICLHLEADKPPRHVRWSVDVDCQDLT